MVLCKSASARFQISPDLFEQWKEGMSRVNRQLLDSVNFWKRSGNLELSAYPNRHKVWDIFLD